MATRTVPFAATLHYLGRVKGVQLRHGASFSVWPHAALLDVLTWVQVLAAVNTYEQVRCLPARSRLATAQPR